MNKPLMNDPELVRFLRWCLPKLGLRWAGFRKVRGTVRKRVTRRIRELKLPDLATDRERLRQEGSAALSGSEVADDTDDDRKGIF